MRLRSDHEQSPPSLLHGFILSILIRSPSVHDPLHVTSHPTSATP
jgi:hypothetical protein